MFSVMCVLVGRLLTLFSFVCALIAGALQHPKQAEPSITRDAISVHTVERGDMPLREIVAGSVASVQPPRVTVSLSSRQVGVIKIGQPCSVQLHPPTVTAGKVGRLMRNSAGAVSAELYLDEAIPQGTAIGDLAPGLIEIGDTAHDIVFFARSADARPNSDSTIFRLDPDGQHATRVAVKYGRQSGALMEILAGLSPGDKVIVSDMSPYAGVDRVTLK